MTPERRKRPRPAVDLILRKLSNAELDKAIRELNDKVRALMEEPDARHGGNLQSSVPRQHERYDGDGGPLTSPGADPI